ncbi:uncharacterized protein LOC132543616 [Ylistrum balloti]|uniref:uncharacterized protein LOC132543616 n=1 Tax=Ylistrum balloti TaxID=509963 RepID=UPI002905F686|nr:uncharacterized protein LOC132543616 [Ylistrum balloti]
MRWLSVEAFIILLGSNIVASNSICPNDLSAYCECTTQSNQVYISCLYPDPFNVTKILSTPLDKLQPSWIIQYFGIPNNSLIDLPDDYFDGFHTISVLDVSSNHFTSIPKALNQLSKTTEINLSLNRLVSLNILDLSGFKSLRKLDLSNNSITDVVLTTPGVTMPTLREINLNSNNITNFDSRSLLTFPNLRNLIMSKNPNFEAISDVEFPEHMSAMRLESNRIKTIDVCKFQLLNDLESLNLNDNDLECTCDFFSLSFWVEANRDDGLVHEVHGTKPNWDCLENGMTVNLSDFGARMCNITSILLTTNMCAEIQPVQLPIISEFRVIITSAESENIVLEWDSPNTTILYGFVVIVSSDDEPLYKSAILHPDTLSHSVQGSDVKSGNFKVCVQVLLYNDTIVGKEDCKTIHIFSSQIIVGILAGVVFIVPFMAILFCIIRLDRRNINQYLHIQEELNFDANKTDAESGTKAEKDSRQTDEKKSTTNSTLSFAPSKTLPPVTSTASEPAAAESGTLNPSFVDGEKITAKEPESTIYITKIPVTHDPKYGAISSH